MSRTTTILAAIVATTSLLMFSSCLEPRSWVYLQSISFCTELSESDECVSWRSFYASATAVVDDTERCTIPDVNICNVWIVDPDFFDPEGIEAYGIRMIFSVNRDVMVEEWGGFYRVEDPEMWFESDEQIDHYNWQIQFYGNIEFDSMEDGRTFHHCDRLMAATVLRDDGVLEGIEVAMPCMM